jgi:hypothetical protein
LSHLHPTFQEPDIRIDDATLDSWQLDQLDNADALLTAAITESRNTHHHALASRALVRAHLRQWDAALVDAEQVLVALFSHPLSLTSVYTKAIKIQPSVIGYIAKAVALVSNGERHKAYRACDIAFERFHSSHVTFLLLVKVCIFRTWLPLSCSYPLGHHRIYGWRASRRHISRRRPHRYGPLQLHLLCSSGTCTRSTTRRTSPLTFPAGIYVSSPWKLAHGAQRLRGCNTIVRACTSPNTTPRESSTLGGLTGKFADGYIAAHRNDLRSLTDIWMEV